MFYRLEGSGALEAGRSGPAAGHPPRGSVADVTITGDGAERRCDRCDALLPDQRTVCPACGALQRARQRPTGPAATPAGAPAGATPRPDPIGAPWQPARPPRVVVAPTAAAKATPTGTPKASTTPPGRRSRPIGVVAMVVVAVLAIGSVALLVTRDDRESPDASAPKGTGRSAAVRGFCDDPRPLRGPGTIATFTPGSGTVAYASLPQPPSGTEPSEEVVLQASPIVGEPDLRLERSIDLVSLAVCISPTRSTTTAGRCSYRVTTPGSLGDEATEKLVRTTYEVRIVELRTAKAIAEGTIDSAVDRCPEFARLTGKGVANALTPGDVAAFIGLQMPGGVPA